MKAIFCGDGMLLADCLEIFEKNGGQVMGIITSDANLQARAEEKSYALLGTPEKVAKDIPSVDFVFNIVNFKPLPNHLLDAAKSMAINVQGGLLPNYDGSNAASWALLAGEEEHGVTWYKIGTPDQVLKETVFDILPDDTAFTLETKGYQFAQESFSDLVADLVSGKIEVVRDVEKKTVYSENQKPARLGLLDFTQTSEVVSAQARALDFGLGENQLCLPKLWDGDQLLTVGAVNIGTETGNPSGYVISVEEGKIEVATSDGSIILSDLHSLSGKPTSSTMKAGDVITDCVIPNAENIGKNEPKWTKDLMAMTPCFPPHPTQHTNEEGYTEFDLRSNASGSELGAAWLAWCQLMSGQEALSLGLFAKQKSPLEASVLPLFLETSTSNKPADLISLLDKSIADANDRSPMASDLIVRQPSVSQDGMIRALSVILCETSKEVEQSSALIGLVSEGPKLVIKTGTFEPDVISAIESQFSDFLNLFLASSAPIETLPLVSVDSTENMTRSGDVFESSLRVHEAFEKQVKATPDGIALEVGKQKLSYEELNKRANTLAEALCERGAKPGAIVGLCHEREVELIVALFAILKTGAAYLPLDPTYPSERISYMIEDSGTDLIVASSSAATKMAIDPSKVISPDATGKSAKMPSGKSTDLAYLIYTSGSTGKPKGVMVEHKNVLNFFAGMDERVPFSEKARILSVTSVSFDISVLEIFWTLARGATVVLQSDGKGEQEIPGFSLFYFASAAEGETGHQAYRLLLEGARFADKNGFEAVWTPERHFHEFGGLYPNPAVSSAAIAGMTENVKVRAGSCVLPLHHPIRVAEDWSLVDNISNGRAGIALASGWQPNDFVIRPDSFEKRHAILNDGIDQIRALWNGEKLPFPNHKGEEIEVEIHPKPVQKQIPLWVTAAGNPETFAIAGKNGCGVLTHLLGQSIDEVREKVQAYRRAWRDAGHAGNGTVSLMLHTFIGEDEDEVRETVRTPMKNYLRSSLDLLRKASWTSPLFKQKADDLGKTPQEVFEEQDLSDDEMEGLLDHAFERYYVTSGLFGTPESTKDFVRSVAEIGVDEIACLIDFGVDTDLALENLPNIKKLMDGLKEDGGVGRMISVSENILENEVTHLQCTPSMASFITADETGMQALKQLDVMMVGGEAFPPELANVLHKNMDGTLLNMYGPTETTIWSSVAELVEVGPKIPLGLPISNTSLSIRSQTGLALPDYVEGELWIGGEGVTRGYFERPELTKERFVEIKEGRFYRTGDLVRRLPNNTLEFLGRIDNQVKISGYRIELGEIESVLSRVNGVKDCVVSDFDFGNGDKRLIGYATAQAGQKLDPKTMRVQVSGTLPDFMVPSQIVVLDALPLTPNGKVDRNALPSPFSVVTSNEVVDASNETEKTISDVWKTLLGLPEISVTDNFFDLGGHSLLVVQVQRQLKEKLGKDISVTDVFRFSTIQSLSAHLSSDAPKESKAKSKGAARAAARRGRMQRR